MDAQNFQTVDLQVGASQLTKNVNYAVLFMWKKILRIKPLKFVAIQSAKIQKLNNLI